MIADTRTVDSDQQYLQLMQAFGDAWNRHDVSALMDAMTQDCIFEASSGPDACGRRYEGANAVRQAYADIFQAFPDAAWQKMRNFVSGSHGYSEWTFVGTRPDGERVEVNGCDLFTFRDGRIVTKNSFRKSRTR
jgi:ketosteroid isomerase-like protein